MPRARQPWFRFYTADLYDERLRHQPVTQRWVWLAVLAAARQSPEPGVLLTADGVPLDTVKLADAANVRRRDADSAVDHFLRVGLLELVGLRIQVTGWERYSTRSDEVAVRTAKHRSLEQPKPVPKNVPTSDVGTFLPPDVGTFLPSPSSPLPPTTPNPTPPPPAKQTTARAKRELPLPDDWQPNAKHRQIAAEEGVDCDREAVRMRDWAEGRGVRRASWDATFRNWLRNDALRGAVKSQPQKPRSEPVFDEHGIAKSNAL